MLARREYSRLELERKLASFAENPDDIPGLLDDFERHGWLSEGRVIEQVLASRRRRFGAQRIAHELREKGLSDAAIAGAQLQLQEGELETARAVWMKKFGVVPANARDKARQMRFLQGRGFSLDTIRHLLRDLED
jgi:regulatory protein